MSKALIADGCVIGEGTTIENSVIGLRCRIGKNVTIRNSIIMGSDFYESAPGSSGSTDIGIGDGCVIENAIIDKNCRLGAGAVVSPGSLTEADLKSPDLYVRDSILVTPKNTIIPAGWKIDQE